MLFLCAIFLPFSTAGLEVANYLALLGFLIGGSYLQKLSFIKQSPLAFAALAFYLIVLLCSIYAPSIGLGIPQSFRAYEKVFLIPVGLWTLSRFPKFQRYFLVILSLGLLINFIIGFCKVHYIWPWHMTFQNNAFASFGSFKRDSGHIALSYFASVLAFSLGIVLIHQFRTLSQWQKLTLGFGALFSLYYLLGVTDGRSGLVTFIVLIAYFLFRMVWNFKYYKASILTLVLTVLVIGLAYHYSATLKKSLSNTALDFQQSEQGVVGPSWGVRLNFWKNSIHLIAQKPFFGYGTGSMQQLHSSLHKNHNSSFIPIPNPHNQYLFLWVEEGIPGLLSFLVLLYMGGKNNLSFKTSSLNQQTLKMLLEGNVFAFAVGCLYNSWLHDVHEGFFIIMLWIGFHALLKNHDRPITITKNVN